MPVVHADHLNQQMQILCEGTGSHTPASVRVASSRTSQRGGCILAALEARMRFIINASSQTLLTSLPGKHAADEWKKFYTRRTVGVNIKPLYETSKV